MGQCCHKLPIGNTTFYCVERDGHQCQHTYTVGIDQYKLLHERCEKAEADLAAARTKCDQLVQQMNVMCDQHRDDLKELSTDLAAENAENNKNLAGMMHAKSRLYAAETDLAAARAKYDELLFAVATKHPNETRHQTALRYIQQAERGGDYKGKEAAIDAALAGKP